MTKVVIGVGTEIPINEGKRKSSRRTCWTKSTGQGKVNTAPGRGRWKVVLVSSLITLSAVTN